MHFNVFNDHLPLADLLSLKLYCTLPARFGIVDNDTQRPRKFSKDTILHFTFPLIMQFY